ncbi:MAG: HAMP domain-containing histidine kinase [Gammaproteobacteria bacterium]|nr:HAMP domain-containing histidine kinase [Gammaproteobacteria bacterium]
MTVPESGPATPRSELAWRIVGLANLYRLLVVAVLLGVHFVSRPGPVFGAQRPALFLLALAAYGVAGVLLAAIGRRHWPRRVALLVGHVLVDSLAIAVLLYASGGASSGLAILLVIPVLAMTLLADGREPLLIAATAALAILAQQFATQLAGLSGSSDYTVAGVMGAVVFLVALAAWPVAIRLGESEALVRRQEIDLANLAQLSQYIVQHLRESILVVDPADRIRLINESAAQLLGERAAVPGALLGEVSPRLLYLLSMWRGGREAPPPAADPEAVQHVEPTTFVAADGARVIEPHFAPLGAERPAPVLVFLEDTGVIAAKVQQSKLAALGRLSASIAHEIRNPVGAMSHAAQLLAESGTLGEEDRRLTTIMRSNAARVSDIIENVLQLSRREPARPERLPLGEWCEAFREEFCETLQLAPERLEIGGDAGIEVSADPGQLHQIVWNLCQNALTHGRDPHGGAQPVQIRLGRLAGSSRPFLEVVDRGPGIGAADVERVFEPFFTRAARGTGLGLFLARELAESNGATLFYEPNEGGGSRFRIVFSDPRRWRALQ